MSARLIIQLSQDYDNMGCNI